MTLVTLPPFKPCIKEPCVSLYSTSPTPTVPSFAVLKVIESKGMVKPAEPPTKFQTLDVKSNV